jgi:hypothetical protein
LWVWRDAGNLVYTEIGSTNRPKLKTVWKTLANTKRKILLIERMT